MIRNQQFMELPRKAKRAIEPVDEWLQNEGYYRKHSPKDATCLFRAISEQVYHNQRNHGKVRQECIDFMRENRHTFEEKISIPFDNYLEQLANFTEWGGMNEILAMSLMYKRNVVIFHGQKLTKETAIDHGYQDSFFLCFTPPKQYETVYTQEYTANAGFCQSIIYQLLYKNVFKMNNVEVTVHKMLHERNNPLRHDKFFLKGNVENRNQLTLELINKLEKEEDSEELQLLSKGITPFPYRVAKALDPNIYRNIDYDIWHEIRREVKNLGYTKFNSSELQIGGKCLVKLDVKECDKANNNLSITKENWDNSKAIARSKGIEPLFYTGHIQEMSKNQGPVLVFIEELGQKLNVPFEYLKPFPQRKLKQNNWPMPNKRNIVNQNTKWRKPWNPPNRRIKDQITCDNSNDKNQVTNSKLVTKNVVGNTDSVENQNVKLPVENFVPYKDYNHNGPIENLKVSLENSHISVQTAEQTIDDKTNKNDSQDIPNKKQVSNFNHKTNVVNKQNHLRAEKNDIYYPPYLSTPYQPVFRFPDSESVPYDTSKNVDIKGNEIPSSDPATVRHFYNLGVKFYWSQNTWSNGNNGQPYENSFFLVNPPPDINMNTNMISGPSSNGENVSQVTNPQNINNGPRYNNRSSPPRYRDQENINGPRTNGQKMNNRNSDFRNNTSYQCPSNDVNRNRNDGKNIPSNEQSMQNGNNKDMQRNNKSNGMAPRFKRNYENGKNRNDYHNAQHQYNRQQNQQDYDPRNKKQIDSQMMPNRCDAGDPVQLQQQQQQQLQHQPPYMQQQQPPPMLQPQTPPPLNGAYSYQIPYNQMPYMPIAPYQAESEAFSGQYYSAPTGYVQMPYLPATEMPEPPMYPTLEGFPPQYPPVYSQYVYPPAVYPNQPPPPESCYPPFAGQPVFFPYPPPPQPMQPAGLTNPPTAQSAQ